MPTARLLLIAALSGAWGVALEVLWIRALVLQTGGPLASFTIVLTAVMGGMATGSVLGGRLAASRPGQDLIRRTAGGFPPLRTLAGLQMGIAAATLLAAWMRATGGLTRQTLQALELAPGSAASMIVIAALAGSAALIPSLGLGAALPLLSAAAAPPAARAAGPLAASSALGGALGALLCGFVLLPRAGLRGGLLIAAGAAGLTAMVCLAGRVRGGQSPTAANRPALPAGDAGPGSAAASRLPAILVLASAGAVLTALQIVWSRLAGWCFGSSVQSGSLVLAAVILGLAAGNAFGARRARVAPNPAGSLAGMACAAALSLILSDPILARLPLLTARLEIWLSAWRAGEGAAQAAQLVMMGAIVALPALFLGSIFPLGVAALARRDEPGARPVALAAGVSAAGNILGAPLAFAALAAGAGSRAVWLGVSGLLALAATWAAVRAVEPRRPGAAVALAAALLVVMALPGTGGWLSWDPAIMSSGPYLYASLYGAALRPGEGIEAAMRERGDVILAREGAQALVTVRALPRGVLSMQVNGKTDASTGGDMKVQSLMAHLPLLLMAASGRSLDDVLVVGLGSGVTLAGALAHPVRSVTVVELLREVVDASPPFEQANRGGLNDMRTRLLVGDARARLMFEDRDYDVIVSQPSNPWIAGQAVLFTREFFTLARSRLRPGGLMCQWLQSYGLQPDDFRSVVATFASVFPEVTLWEESVTGGDYLLVGSDRPHLSDGVALSQAASRPAVREDLERIEITGAAGLLSHFVSGGDALRRWIDQSPVALQSEDRLALEFTAAAALRSETPGLVLAGLEPARQDPEILLHGGSAGNGALLAQVGQLRREAARERRWAAGLGLLAAQRPPDPRLLLASSYLRAGMAREASSVLRAIRANDDSDRLARLLLAHLAMREGRPAEAVRELQAAAAQDPNDAGARLYLSRALWASGDLIGALGANDAALALDEGRAETWSDRCGLLLAAGDLAGAEAACREAISRDAKMPEPHANLGLVHARRWRVEEAELSYRRALDLDPGMIDARFNLAALLERVGRSADGMAALEPALAPGAAPDAATLRLGARLAISLGRLEEAEAWLEESLVLDPSSGEAALLRAAIRRLAIGKTR